MAAPMISGDEVIGVLNIESSRENAFDKQKQSTLLVFAKQAAFAVSDYVVNETVGEKILARIKSTDIIMLYQFQIMIYGKI